jgi:hypothetical protein
VLEPRLAFDQLPLEPAHRSTLELRRASLGVEMDGRIAESQNRQESHVMIKAAR